MQAANTFLLVFLGAGLGGVLRHGTTLAAVRITSLGLPFGTFLVNVGGAMAMGMIAGSRSFHHPSGQEFRLFLTTGVLGGFTTFSAFSYEAVSLWQRGRARDAVAYAVGSVLLSLAALLVGLALTNQ